MTTDEQPCIWQQRCEAMRVGGQVNALERIAAALETIGVQMQLLSNSERRRVQELEQEVAAQGDMLHLLTETIRKTETQIEALSVKRGRPRPRKEVQP